MTPQPKRRHSKGRTHRRRAHDFLTVTKLTECPSCHTMRLAHRACPNCGSYHGRVAIQVKSES